MSPRSKSDYPSLPQIHIPEPCPMQWQDLHPDAARQRDSRRFCDQCEKYVLNFSEMTTQEVNEALRCETSICAQIQKRSDGTLVTNDNAITRRSWLGRFTRLAACLLGVATLVGCDENRFRRFLSRFGARRPSPPPIAGEVEIEPLMGDVAIPPERELTQLQSTPEPVRGRVQVTPKMLGKLQPQRPPKSN